MKLILRFIALKMSILRVDAAIIKRKKVKRNVYTGGSPAENAQIVRDILSGAQGPKTDAVLINAGAAIHIAAGVSLEEGIERARQALRTGAALEQLERFIAASNRP